MIVIAIISLFLVAGILGGYVGYLQDLRISDEPSLAKRDPSANSATVSSTISGKRSVAKDKSLLYRSLVFGIVGAFLVPVLLTIIRATSGTDKDLLDQLSSDTSGISHWFVLFGLALLAAISSQRLIPNLTKNLLGELVERTEAAEKTAAAAMREVDEMDNEVEVLNKVAVEDRLSDGDLDVSEPLDELSLKVLKAIYYEPSKPRPSKSQIAQATNLNEEQIAQALRDLENKNLVRAKDYDGTIRYRVRTAGKILLAHRHLPIEKPSGGDSTD